ncbi:MAG: 3-deoxy-7-phosphoheptulonate synthase [Spirochaetes bacterium]|nr:3-deoxy-7-phosphoheptulonate synthase [Spirochaetota bacterium]
MKDWTPYSWKKLKAAHQPKYPDQKILDNVLKQLRTYPPLVFSGEVELLKTQLKEAALNKRFILQGGDCAERFIDCTAENITNKIKIILQMSVILTYCARRPVIRLGRIAGQYAKPRSQYTENINNQEMYTYRGDGVNDFQPDQQKRMPDPNRLVKAYYHSVITHNYIRAMISGGFADLHHPYHWNLHSIEDHPEWAKYQQTVEHILDAINFTESFGGLKAESLGKIDFFTSHEGLLLDYEAALTRKNAENNLYYNLSTHMLWIGERTRQLDGAHVEYFSGIANPIGVKIGPSISSDELIDLCKKINPFNDPGKLVLISRMGAEKINDILPSLIQCLQKEKINVVWSCDPMHGNTMSIGQHKTRRFVNILSEIKSAFQIHKNLNSTLAGVHFELTGEDVTECIGGIQDVDLKDLGKNYTSYCDPRLNYTQSMEMAFSISQWLAKQ